METQTLDADLISLESMIAARESAESALRTMIATEEATALAFWMLIATSVSLIFSAAMIYYAFRALSTWREQEQLKVKVDFKKSIISMYDILLVMPNSNLTFLSNIGRSAIAMSGGNQTLTPTKETTAFYQKNALADAYEKAEHNWAISEELFIGTKTHKDWEDFKRAYFNYAKLNLKKDGLCELLSTMKSELVIFDPKESMIKRISHIFKVRPPKQPAAD